MGIGRSAILPIARIPAFGKGLIVPSSVSRYWTQQSKGLIFKTDFEDISSWVNDGTFSKIADDALISFDPLPTAPYYPAGTDGARECVILKENSILYFFYDSPIDGVSYCTTYWAQSSDNGKTWTYNGQFGSGYTKGVGGLWAATALGWVGKLGNKYYHYKLAADAGGLCDTPNNWFPCSSYVGEIWSADTLAGTWTYLGLLPTFGGTWANGWLITGSVLKVGSNYYMATQGYNASIVPSGGLIKSSTPYGTWTLITNPFLTPAMIDAATGSTNRYPENPKLFYHSVLNKYGQLSNSYLNSGVIPGENYIQLSSNIEDWSGVSLRKFQGNSIMDATSSLRTIGVETPLVDQDGLILIGSNGFFPVVYDSDGTKYSSIYQYGRKAKIILMEPSRNVLRFNGSASGKIYKVQSNTDFIIEFGVQFPTNTASETLSFIYRADGTGANEYRLIIQNGGAKLKLVKRISGSNTTIETGTASQVVELGMINRIKIVISGTSHKAYINGQLQINSTDSALSSGTHIGFMGENVVNGDIRIASLRSSDVVTVNGLIEGTEVELRADGGIVAASTLANASGIATFTLSHWPMESIYFNGVNNIYSGGIWGGDVFTNSTSLPTPVKNTIVSATVENAAPANVVVTFAHNLNSGVLPNISCFALAGKTILSISISGIVLTVTVSVAYSNGSSINLGYTRPQTNMLRSNPDTSYIDSFTQTVTSNVTDNDANAYIARMTVAPNAATETLIRQFFADLKSNGIYSELDQYVLMNLHDAQASKLDISPNHIDHTWLGSPTWAAKVGVTIAVGKTVQSNFNPVVNAVKFTLNNCAIVETRNGTLTTGFCGIEHIVDGTHYRELTFCNTAYAAYQSMNGAKDGLYTKQLSTGFNIGARPNATQVIVRTGGTEFTISQNSYMIPGVVGKNTFFNIGGLLDYNAASPDSYSVVAECVGTIWAQHGFASSMDATKRAKFQELIDAFNVAIQTAF